MRKRFLLALLLVPQLALAAPQVSSEEQLFADLAKANSPEDAQPIEEKLTGFFKVSGSPSVDLLMTRAASALSDADNATARKLLDAVTRVAPHYAEGWHQRAQLQAAANDDAGAMLSLQKAVAINPRQFQAMAELAGMLEDYGDKPGALKLYRRVLQLDPQMSGVARQEKALEKEVEGQGI
jgi:tetratricopeptide (TPR) repeat protein